MISAGEFSREKLLFFPTLWFPVAVDNVLGVRVGIFFVFVFLFGHAHGIWKFLGQGSSPSHIYDLHHSCSSTGSLTHCAQLGIKLMPPQRQCSILNQLSHSENSENLAIILTRGDLLSLSLSLRAEEHLRKEDKLTTALGRILSEFPSSSYACMCVCVCFLTATPAACESSQVRDQIRAADTRLHYSHSHTESLTHWLRSEIERTASWRFVRFVTAEPQWELLSFPVLVLLHLTESQELGGSALERVKICCIKPVVAPYSSLPPSFTRHPFRWLWARGAPIPRGWTHRCSGEGPFPLGAVTCLGSLLTAFHFLRILSRNENNNYHPVGLSVDIRRKKNSVIWSVWKERRKECCVICWAPKVHLRFSGASLNHKPGPSANSKTEDFQRPLSSKRWALMNVSFCSEQRKFSRSMPFGARGFRACFLRTTVTFRNGDKHLKESMSNIHVIREGHTHHCYAWGLRPWSLYSTSPGVLSINSAKD